MHPLATDSAFVDFCARAAAILLDAGLKGILLLFLAALVSLALRRRSAALRHLVWALAMGGLLLLPLLSVTTPKWRFPLLPRDSIVPRDWFESKGPLKETEPSKPEPVRDDSGWPTKKSDGAPANLIDVAPPGSLQPTAAIAPPPPSAPRRALPPAFWALLVWLAGALAALVPLLAGHLIIWRVLRRAQPMGDADAWDSVVAQPPSAVSDDACPAEFRISQPGAAVPQNLFRYLRRLLNGDGPRDVGSHDAGGRRRVRLLRARGAAMPMAAGLFRPVILLPADFPDWPAEKRRAVLLHELAHVRRRDCLTHVLARLAAALHWFNPLAWRALRRMRIEREQACDDLVLLSGERPSSYADHLLEIARTTRPAPLTSAAAITMARKSQIEGRLLAILDSARDRKLVTPRAFGLASLLLVVFISVLAAMQVIGPDEKAQAVAEEQEQSAADGDASSVAEFSSGAWATLLGIALHPRAADEYWTPDGQRRAGVPAGFEDIGARSFPGEKEIAREFYVRIDYPPAQERISVRYEVEPRGGGSAGGPEQEDGQVRLGFAASLPANASEAKLRIGVAAGPWKTVLTGRPNSTSGFSSFSVIYSSAIHADGKLHMTVTDNVLELDYRVVAVDPSGTEYATGARSTASGDMRQSQYVWSDIPEGVEIKSFDFQVRDYEWREIKNIPLNPDSRARIEADPRVSRERDGEAQTPASTNSETAATTGTLAWGEAVNGLRAAVELDRSLEVYSMADVVEVRFHVQNVSDHPIQLYSDRIRRDHTTLKDARGISLSTQEFYDFPAGPLDERRNLAPGESWTLSHFPPPSFLDMSVPGPGKYTISYRLPFPNGGQPEPGDWQGELATGEWPITIAAAEMTGDSLTAAAREEFFVSFLPDRSRLASTLTTDGVEYHWLIDTDQPVRVARGWFSLREDGESVMEHAGGGEQGDAEAGPVELIFKAAFAEAGLLDISLERRRDTATVKGGLTTRYKLEIPEGATIECRHLDATASLDDANQTALWEGRFVRDGRVLETLIVTAAATREPPLAAIDNFRPPGKYPDGTEGLPVIRLPHEPITAASHPWVDSFLNHTPDTDAAFGSAAFDVIQQYEYYLKAIKHPFSDDPGWPTTQIAHSPEEIEALPQSPYYQERFAFADFLEGEFIPRAARFTEAFQRGDLSHYEVENFIGAMRRALEVTREYLAPRANLDLSIRATDRIMIPLTELLRRGAARYPATLEGRQAGDAWREWERQWRTRTIAHLKGLQREQAMAQGLPGAFPAPYFPAPVELPAAELRPLIEEWDRTIARAPGYPEDLLRRVRQLVPKGMIYEDKHVLRYINPEVQQRVIELYRKAAPHANEPEVDGRPNPWYDDEGAGMTYLATLAESTLSPAIKDLEFSIQGWGAGELQTLYLAAVEPLHTIDVLTSATLGHRRVGDKGAGADYLYRYEDGEGLGGIDDAFAILSMMSNVAPEALRERREAVIRFVARNAKHYSRARKHSGGMLKPSPIIDLRVRLDALSILRVVGGRPEIALVETIFQDPPDSPGIQQSHRESLEEFKTDGPELVEVLKTR